MLNIEANSFDAKAIMHTGDFVKENHKSGTMANGCAFAKNLKGDYNSSNKTQINTQSCHTQNCETNYDGANEYFTSGYSGSQTSQSTLTPAQNNYNKVLNDFKNDRASVDDYIVALRSLNEENASLGGSVANSYDAEFNYYRDNYNYFS